MLDTGCLVKAGGNACLQGTGVEKLQSVMVCIKYVTVDIDTKRKIGQNMKIVKTFRYIEALVTYFLICLHMHEILTSLFTVDSILFKVLILF